MNLIQRLSMTLVNLGLKAAAPAPSPVAFTSTTNDGRPIAPAWSTDKAVREGLKASTWVYIGARRIAQAVSSVHLVVQRRNGDTWEPDPAHPAQQLLDRPNPFMTQQNVVSTWAYHMSLGGNALWWINSGLKPDGVPLELWPISPDQIRPIQDRATYLRGYEYRPTNHRRDDIVFQPHQVMHWKFPDPSDSYWGLSPIMAAAKAIDTDIAASAWNRAVLQGGGMPPAAVMLDASVNPDNARKFQTMIQDQVGGIGNARKFLILGGTTKVQPLALTAQELDWLNGRKFSREEIGGVLGVPPILMVPGENVTFANLEGAKRVFWEDTVVPLLTDLAQGLTHGLLPRFGASDTHRIVADLSNVAALQDNMSTKATVAKTLVDAGWPINAVNRRLELGFDDIEGGDTPRAPAAPVAATPGVKSRDRPGHRRRERKDKGDGDADLEDRLGRIDKWTEQAQKRVSELLLQHGTLLASAYADGSLDEELDLSMDDWQTLLEAVHQVILEEEGAVAYTALLTAITGSGKGGTFDVLADHVVDWIAERTGAMVKGITDTTRTKLAAVVSEGVEAGESTDKIAGRIKAQFKDWSAARAVLIARTEVGTAFSAAHQLSAEQVQSDADTPLVKTWRSVGDARVRDAHDDMDGETVNLDAKFSNGLQYPSEPNCRCVVTYHPSDSS